MSQRVCGSRHKRSSVFCFVFFFTHVGGGICIYLHQRFARTADRLTGACATRRGEKMWDNWRREWRPRKGGKRERMLQRTGEKKQSERDADSACLLSSPPPPLSALIGVSSLPLTKCRQGRARAASRPSAFIGLPDNKDWCLGGMPQKECAVNMSALPNAAFMNMYPLIKPTWQFSDRAQCRRIRFFPGLRPPPLSLFNLTSLSAFQHT